MHRIHGVGLHSCAQAGRNTLRRDHLQSLGQDWPEEGEIQREVSNQIRTKDPASKGRNVCPPRTQQKLVCEVFSSIKTLDRKFERMVLVRRIYSCRLEAV